MRQYVSADLNPTIPYGAGKHHYVLQIDLYGHNVDWEAESYVKANIDWAGDYVLTSPRESHFFEPGDRMGLVRKAKHRLVDQPVLGHLPADNS